MRRALAVAAAAALTVSACDRIQANREPWCRAVAPTILLAGSVSDARYVPCVRTLPAGWAFAAFDASDEGGGFSLEAPTDVGGRADVALRSDCGAPAGRAIETDEPGTELHEEVRARDPYAATRTYRFEGGCITVDIQLRGAVATRDALEEIDASISVLPREAITPAS